MTARKAEKTDILIDQRLNPLQTVRVIEPNKGRIFPLTNVGLNPLQTVRVIELMAGE